MLDGSQRSESSEVGADRIDRLAQKVDGLESQIKEREIFFFRAIKTLIEDFRAYRRGERPDFNAALVGVVVAYMRPRVVVLLGSLAAVLFAGLQIGILYRQNEILERQNAASDVHAVSQIVASLDPSNTVRSMIAVQQLKEHGDAAFPVLVRLAQIPIGDRESMHLASLALEAVLGRGQEHSPAQTRGVLDAVSHLLAAFEQAANQHAIEVRAAERASLLEEPPPAAWLEERQVILVPPLSEYLQVARSRALADPAYRTSLRELVGDPSYYVKLLSPPNSILIWTDTILLDLVRVLHGLGTVSVDTSRLSAVSESACGMHEPTLQLRAAAYARDRLEMRLEALEGSAADETRDALEKQLGSASNALRRASGLVDGVDGRDWRERKRRAAWALRRHTESWLEPTPTPIETLEAATPPEGYPVPSPCRGELSAQSGLIQSYW